MRISYTGALSLTLVALIGCGVKQASVSSSTGATSGIPSAQVAGQMTYRYALSAQVLNASNNQAIKNFSIALAAQDPAVSTVVNALGNLNGLFHISRTPSTQQAATTALPVLISAPGFQSVLQTLTVGADCQTASCAGSRPLSVLLQPLVSALSPVVGSSSAGSSSASSTVATTAATVAGAVSNQLLNGQGLDQVLQDLVGSGKIDSTAQSLLSGSGNNILSNVVLLLNGQSGSQTGNTVSSLLGSVTNPQLQSLISSVGGASGLANILSGAQSGKGIASLLPALTGGASGVGGALTAVSALLPYLKPILQTSSSTATGPLGQVLAGFLSNPQANLSSILNLVQPSASGQSGVQLAAAGLLPLVQGLLSSVPSASGTQHPFLSILQNALNNPGVLQSLTSGTAATTTASQGVSSLLTYLQPLLQGLAGTNQSELATLFNSLVQGGGLDAIKNIAQNPSQDTFAKLLPFIQPLVSGLNSGDAQALTSLLAPVLSSSNPAGTLQSLLASGGGSNVLQVASTLFPNLQTVLQQAVPGKQLLGSQILQGLLSGSLKNVSVQSDLPGASGVVVSGLASDIAKLAQLPNVQQVLVGGTN